MSESSTWHSCSCEKYTWHLLGTYHTAAILLTDPQARLVALFTPPHKAADITDQLARIEGFIAGH